ncbi:hypothetical protein LTR86_011228 [Recurvomyces mirabilis]|nr:hypothetical protein LTR86_011228 [Recurvomyces mirabilis]
MNRTSNYLVLTDCAFLFFQGIQPRLWDPEIQCDLSCPEDVFDAAHPFTHPDFSFKRASTAQQAFRTLFEARHEAYHSTGLTMLDSFVLIHKIRTALNKWFEIWTSLHDDAVSSNTWDKVGFFKNGDQHAYATLLLLSSKARPYLQRLLAPGAERLGILQELNK